MSKYFIEQVCKSHRITDYLESQKVYPRRDSDGKQVYHCPLPGHANDNSPSFYVYDKGEVQDYYCFGCKSGGGIIQLVAEMEQISIKDSISKLSNGLDIDMSDVIDHIVRDIIVVTGGEDNSAETVLQMVMYVSTVCHDYLRRVEFDPKEVAVCDKLHALCDNLMKSRDRRALQEVIDLLPQHLGRRYEDWAIRKETEDAESFKAWQV